MSAFIDFSTENAEILIYLHFIPAQIAIRGGRPKSISKLPFCHAEQNESRYPDFPISFFIPNFAPERKNVAPLHRFAS